MCVTNIYVDRYPDGREVEFRQLSTCQYGLPNRPCSSHSILENPIRKIAFGEPTTQYMMTNTIFSSTPPRSSGGSHRHSAGSSRSHRHLSSSPATSEDSRRHRHNKSSSKPHRTHRKERIIIVDAPPTPRTPPQPFQQTFSVPSSPNMFFHNSRARPIIVDERSMRPTRSPSLGPTRPLAGDRSQPIPIPARRLSVSRSAWDTPSSSHTSFDLKAERAREEKRLEERELENARRARLLVEQAAAQDAAARRAQRLAELDEEIRRRPAVPIAPRPLNQRAYIRPIVDNSQALSGLMGGLTLGSAHPERTHLASSRLENVEAEAMRQRLRERQLPRRRFSVGPGNRRSRVVYENGVYRYE